MRIAVVSDTHGHVAYTQDAIERIRSLNVSAVLHCGDIGSPEIVPLFAEWLTHFVFGNVDRAGALTGSIESAGQTCHGQFGRLELAGRRIALLHSHDRAKFLEVTTSGEFDLVCYGHTHVAEHHLVGETLVLNPGALFRATPHSLAVVDLADMVCDRIQLL